MTTTRRLAAEGHTTPRLLIVSNRLPVTVAEGDHGRPVVRRSVGGLATGLAGPHARGDSLWIGWPGHAAGDEAHDAAVSRALATLRAVPVPLTASEVEVFYEHIANGVLWPVCHDRIDRLPLRVSGWDVYEGVNARFADVIAAHWRPGDLVWIHDYHLLRLPALVRERIPGARIGFFLHIPFPNPESFFTLPARRALLEGMLGADVVGFHTRRYAGHFATTVQRALGLAIDEGDRIVHGQRSTLVGAFPMGVDAEDFARRAVAAAVDRRAAELRGGQHGLLVGVDRLDYSKGIPRRLLAVERLLEKYPEWHGRVRLVQIAVPSRGRVGAYRRFRGEVEALVGRINGEFGTPSWTPIQYIYRAVDAEMLLALYRAADLMLVTPVRDGMNLVAKEFVATRADEDGVLVLSEFAGAADDLTDAVIVNPYDVDGVADAMHRSLTMSRAERRGRMRRLREQVFRHDVHWWAAECLAALQGS